MAEPFTISAVRREIFQKLAGLFIWDLPADIPPEFVEYELLKNGMCGFFKYEGKPQAVRVSYSGEPNSYFVHEKFIYANPIIGSGTLTDGENAVIGYNEPMAKWTPKTTYNIICKYADLWNAADISLKIGVVNTRLMFIGTADNQQTIQGYNDLISAVWNGKPAFAVNADTLINEGLKILPTANIAADYLRQISETREYIINSCLSAFGVHANTILKRERQLVNEIDLQTERPTFNIYTMLAEREKLAEKLAAFYDYPVSVKLNPILNQYDNTDSEVMNEPTKNEVVYQDTDSIVMQKESEPVEPSKSETHDENND